MFEYMCVCTGFHTGFLVWEGWDGGNSKFQCCRGGSVQHITASEV